MPKSAQLHPQLMQAIQLCESGQSNKAEKALKKFGKQNDHNAAVAQRYLAIIASQEKRHADALTYMRKAVTLQKDSAQFLFELGVVCKAADQTDAAIDAYQQAIELDPTFIRAHFNLANLLGQQNKTDEAVRHYQQALKHKPDYHAAFVNLCALLDQQQDTETLAQLCDQYANSNPGFAYIDYFRGRLWHQSGEFEKAVGAYTETLNKLPSFPEALYQRASAQHQLQQDEAAYQDLQQLIAKQPNAAALHLLGVLHHQQRDLKQAQNCYEEAIKLDPTRVDTLCNLAEVLEKTHQNSAAETIIDQALTLAPEHILARRIKATLLRHQQEYDAAIAILTALPEPADAQEAVNLHFELGQLYDKDNQPETAFTHFQTGNQFLEKVADVAAEKQRYLATVERLENQFTNNWLQTWTETPALAQKTPHFIVGFPRSGTTLTGQMLDAHPQIQVVEEDFPLLTDIEQSIKQMTDGYPAALAQLSNSEIEELREKYFALIAQRYEIGDKQVIEKLPLNMMHAGLIRRLFPEAKFLLILRHPMDACLSCYMQAFAPNGAMANFTSMDETIAFYDRAMKLWYRYCMLLKLDVHNIKYENLIDDQAGEMKTALEFLDIEWRDEVLNYAEHARQQTISTPSYSQVVKPLYQSARYRWQRYPQMENYVGRLQRWIEHYEYKD